MIFFGHRGVGDLLELRDETFMPIRAQGLALDPNGPRLLSTGRRSPGEPSISGRDRLCTLPTKSKSMASSSTLDDHRTQQQRSQQVVLDVVALAANRFLVDDVLLAIEQGA